METSKATHIARGYTCQHLPAYDTITNISKPSVAYKTVFFFESTSGAGGCGPSLALCSVRLFIPGSKYRHSSYTRCTVPQAGRIKSKILDSDMPWPSALQFLFHWPKQFCGQPDMGWGSALLLESAPVTGQLTRSFKRPSHWQRGRARDEEQYFTVGAGEPYTGFYCLLDGMNP